MLFKSKSRPRIKNEGGPLSFFFIIRCYCLLDHVTVYWSMIVLLCSRLDLESCSIYLENMTRPSTVSQPHYKFDQMLVLCCVSLNKIVFFKISYSKFFVQWWLCISEQINSNGLFILNFLTDLWTGLHDELFSRVVRMSNHVLHTLLPPPSIASQNYNLQHRTHLLQLPAHSTHLTDCTFITRMLYKDTY